MDGGWERRESARNGAAGDAPLRDPLRRRLCLFRTIPREPRVPAGGQAKCGTIAPRGMALTAVVSRDREVCDRARAALDSHRHDVLVAPTLGFARRRIRDRPVAIVLLDDRCLPEPPSRAVACVQGLWRRFPSVPVGVLASARHHVLLHELGLAGLRHLALREEGGVRVLTRLFHDLLAECAGARVVQRLAPALERVHLRVLADALDLTHRQVGADEFAAECGLSRPYLSRRLQEGGLPSTGRLLIWARLFHAGFWMPDPGRSGESVSRQLEYANGSTFRRALRSYVGLTPTEVRAAGGLDVVLEAFALQSGFELPGSARWVA